MAQPIFTIGHSTRPFDELAGMLAANGVTRLADVRTVPRSRRNPQYDGERLAGALAERRIAYEHIPALGGLRPRARHVPPEVNGLWRNQSFHNYADYAMGPEFAAGLGHLRALARGERVAVMCAESVWWQCHRRIVADYLLAAGEDVFHLVSGEVPEPASLTPGALPGPGGTLVYPQPQADLGL